MRKNVLKLSESQARKFFLKEESYFNFDLPVYFTFFNLLNKLSKKLNNKNITDFYATDENGKAVKPEHFEGVNYKLLSNKSGQYAWRPFQLIHPALYVALVCNITEKENWCALKQRFNSFRKDEKIKCVSLPVVSETPQSDKAEQINYWWEEIEQKSIELALDYEYLYHVDITDCYGSIYTHSISWAIHGKDKMKEANQRNNKNLFGNQIDKNLQKMSYGQTNGIPQGSVLMDFFAEIILGYADSLLLEKTNPEEDFKILRYRDDYRVFANNSQTAQGVIKNLSEVLADLGLSLNDYKTVKSNYIVRDSIKPDKFCWEITNKIGLANTLQAQLLIINDLAETYPNSGSVSKQLQVFYKTIKTKKEIKENIKVLISIVVDIAFKNPRTYPISTAIVSKFISFLTEKESISIIGKIRKKFEKIPNTGHLQIWLQRLSIKIDGKLKYNEKLCLKIENNQVNLWCSDWLNDSIKDIINKTKIVDTSQIETMDPVISVDEVELFKQFYYS